MIQGPGGRKAPGLFVQFMFSAASRNSGGRYRPLARQPAPADWGASGSGRIGDGRAGIHTVRIPCPGLEETRPTGSWP